MVDTQAVIIQLRAELDTERELAKKAEAALENTDFTLRRTVQLMLGRDEQISTLTQERDEANAYIGESDNAILELTQERDAAQARIAALESVLVQAQKALEPFALADQNWLTTAIRSGHCKEASIVHEAIERLLTGARRDA